MTQFEHARGLVFAFVGHLVRYLDPVYSAYAWPCRRRHSAAVHVPKTDRGVIAAERPMKSDGSRKLGGQLSCIPARR